MRETDSALVHDDGSSRYWSSNSISPETWMNYPSNNTRNDKPHSGATNYDPLYAAASNVLGLSPPPPSSIEGDRLQVTPSFSQSSFPNTAVSGHPSLRPSYDSGGSANSQTNYLVPPSGFSPSARTLSDASSIMTQGSGESASRPQLQPPDVDRIRACKCCKVKRHVPAGHPSRISLEGLA